MKLESTACLAISKQLQTETNELRNEIMKQKKNLKIMSISIPVETEDELKYWAEQLGQSRSAVVIAAVEKYFEQLKREGAE